MRKQNEESVKKPKATTQVILFAWFGVDKKGNADGRGAGLGRKTNGESFTNNKGVDMQDRSNLKCRRLVGYHFYQTGDEGVLPVGVDVLGCN